MSVNPVSDCVFPHKRVLDKVDQVNRRKLLALALINYDLDVVPYAVFTCSHISTLFLGRNNLEVLPHSFKNLCSLTRLELDYNQFSLFPEVLVEMPHIEYLNLSKNPLQDLSSQIGALVNLTSLLCNSCDLMTFPKEIGMLKQLQWLSAKNNVITELPEAFSELENLRYSFLTIRSRYHIIKLRL